MIWLPCTFCPHKLATCTFLSKNKYGGNDETDANSVGLHTDHLVKDDSSS